MTDRPLPFYDRYDFAALLDNLCDDVRAWECAMKNAGTKPWGDTDVIDAADVVRSDVSEVLSQYDAWITERTDLIETLVLMDKAMEQLKLDCYMEVAMKDKEIARLSLDAKLWESSAYGWYNSWQQAVECVAQLKADLEALDKQWRETAAYAEALELGSDAAYWQEQAEMAREETKAADMAAAYWKKVAGDRLDINIRLYETSVQATKQYRELETQHRKLQESIAAALDEAISPTQE